MDEKIYIKKLIRYYELYQDEARHNIQNVLNQMKKHDLKHGEVWQDIMCYWHYTNTKMKILYDVNVKNIPMDDSVVIVILGIKLNDDGTMNEELIGRLQMGLEYANALPSSYIVVTGGPTAKNNPDVTEGGQMASWLMKHGISKDRIILETRAPDTVGNARYTYQLLKKNYPQVTSIVLVTSDYHVARGSCLYYSTLALEAYQLQGQPLNIIANVGYKSGLPGYENINLQSLCMCQIADIDYLDLLYELD